jgi:hypothetical protein
VTSARAMSLLSHATGGHVAGDSVVWSKFFEYRHVSEATGFLGARFSRAQHRTAGVEAAAGGDVGRVGGFAAQDLVGATTADLGGYG